MEFIRRNSKVLFILVLPAYLYIIQNSILNKHTHVYSNGLVITHSHYLNLDGDEPANNHGHSQTEICLYSLLNIGLHIAGEDKPIVFEGVDVFTTYIVEDTQCKYSSHYQHSVSRGPPVQFL